MTLLEQLQGSDLKLPSGFSSWSAASNELRESNFRKYLDLVGPINIAVEIGTHFGMSAAILAQYAKKVITIDVMTYGGLFKDVMWEFLGVKNNIESLVIKSSKEKKKLLGELDYDFVFIDGSHMLESVAFDFDCVQKCPKILFHDYGDNNSWVDVKEFVDSIQDYRWKRETGGGFAYLWREVE